MKGVIDKIWENKTKEGKKYWVLNIGGENYSLWNKKYLEGVEEGATVEYEWTQSGDFKKVTDIKRLDMETDTGFEPKPSYRDRRIVRLSCIKSATLLVSNFDVHPVNRGEMTLDIARKFEKYVTERDGNEEGHQKQEQEK